MPRNRTLQRLIILWQNAVSDLNRRIRQFAHRTKDAVSSSATEVGRSLADAPGSAGSGARRAVRTIPNFFAGLWRSLQRTPAAAASFFKGAARQAREAGDTVKTTVKGAQVQAQEQPAELGRGAVGAWRRTKAFVWERPVWARVLVLMILAGLVSAPFTAKPAYRELIAQRANRLADRAAVMAAEGRGQEASGDDAA